MSFIIDEPDDIADQFVFTVSGYPVITPEGAQYFEALERDNDALRADADRLFQRTVDLSAEIDRRQQDLNRWQLHDIELQRRGHAIRSDLENALEYCRFGLCGTAVGFIQDAISRLGNEGK